MRSRTAQELVIAFTGQNQRIFERNADNIAVPLNPQPVLLRAFYLSPNEDLEKRMPSVRLSLSSPAPGILLKLINSPDGPPNRMARIFEHVREQQINVAPSGRLIKIPARVYQEVSKGGHAWDNDLAKNDPGLFVTGEGDPASIWKVSRVERDAFDAPLVTLSPFVMAGGFPPLDLSSIAHPGACREIASQYSDLQKSFQANAYRAVVTHAKNVAEALIPLKAGLHAKKNFSDTLKKVDQQIERLRHEGKRVPVSELSYHLAQKLRLLHQWTHPDRVIGEGRAITPDFAITAVQDLIEILRDLGCVRP